MRDFQILFDDAEPSAINHPGYAPYGKLSFPAPHHDRPWVYATFVQWIDGVASCKGKHAAGSDISQSPEDRWLMDLLRAHADAILTGVNTLVEEAELGDRERGPVFRIMAPECRELRQQLGLGRERNIIITGAATLDLSAY